jgi:hypothetical protein
MKLLGYAIDVKGNVRQFLRRDRSFVRLLLVTAALDVASTIGFMSVLGTEPESNWIVRIAAAQLGIFVGPVVGKSFQLGGVFGLAAIAPRMSRLVCTVVILMNLLAFVLNMYAFVLG